MKIDFSFETLQLSHTGVFGKPIMNESALWQVSCFRPSISTASEVTMISAHIMETASTHLQRNHHTQAFQAFPDLTKGGELCSHRFNTPRQERSSLPPATPAVPRPLSLAAHRRRSLPVGMSSVHHHTPPTQIAGTDA